MNYPLCEQLEWRDWVVPKNLHAQPIHRWHVFPHSFTPELVYALIDDWGLRSDSLLLDPFVGAGTTLLAAKQKRVPATGYDLSPLAVLSAQVKVADYRHARLRVLASRLDSLIDPSRWNGVKKEYPDLVHQALPGELLGAFEAIDRAIVGLHASATERDFFRLALLSTIPKYSRLIADGGWLKRVERRRSAATLCASFREQVGMMLDDVESNQFPDVPSSWCAKRADARALPDAEATYNAVITSPPYPNRHDYTRVFGVELMFGFLNWEQTRQLRYQSFHSHPEARPKRPPTDQYIEPRSLTRAIAEVREKEKDARVAKMLEGYFLDLYIVLRELRRVCKRQARIALVVGNAQYRGVAINVDELTAEIGEQTGLKCEKLVVARYRGNSAQQMGKYGRKPSRESVVVLRKA